MRKIIYSDSWGEILEIVRYRDTRPGKRGRYVSDKTAKRLRKHKPRKEVYQYRIDKRTKRPDYEAPHIIERAPYQIIKSTFPEGQIDYGSRIWDMVEATNVFTEIHQANEAHFNVRGWNGEKYVRAQGKITVGEHHQAQQLVWAIAQVLDDMEIGVENQWDQSGRIKKAKITGLSDVTITVSLVR